MKVLHIISSWAFLVLAQCSYSAVHLSSSKTGSAIIVPFYTVSNQMHTMLSLNNTTDENKAVKIHFKEAKNGDLLASFNVYLTAQDMWTMTTGQVVSTEGGKIKMVSSDQSCTIGFPNDEIIPIEEDWLWENGTIEIIEMGTINDIEALQASNIDCDALESHWQNNQMWSNNSEAQLSPATGGLHAEVTLMDVEQGHSANIPIIHMDGFYGEDNIQHTAVGDETPNLSTGTKDSLVIRNGQIIETTWPTGYEAVSALMMHNNLTNEFNLEPSVDAKTEWIVSFPTLFYHLNHSETDPVPFKFVDDYIQFPGYYDQSLVYYNREGFYEYFQCLILCPPLPSGQFNHSVNNLVFQLPEDDRPLAPILSHSEGGNTIATEIINLTWGGFIDFHSGKLEVSLNPESGYTLPNNRGHNSLQNNINHTYYGLPVVGFAYTRFTNANAQPGLLAQYAFVREHFGEKNIDTGADQ